MIQSWIGQLDPDSEPEMLNVLGMSLIAHSTLACLSQQIGQCDPRRPNVNKSSLFKSDLESIKGQDPMAWLLGGFKFLLHEAIDARNAETSSAGKEEAQHRA